MPVMLTKHFSKAEFCCKHCGKSGPGFGLQILLTARFMERVRTFLGNRSITVNSGYRCPTHNAAVGGEPNSYHMRGMACDFTVQGLSPAAVQAALELPGSPVLNQGKGSYRTFTHVDRRGSRARWDG